MEVTPHLKSVLKNYQHSATKSLQGPGLSLVTVKNEIPSPEIKEEDFVPAYFPVQQVPILTIPDTSCSERTETILEGESISCFVVGGEKRLCLPQVLNSVLRDFSLQQINQECDQLQIYCSRCTPDQLNVLKNQGILPSGAPSCGLITKTDAERLCSALLYGQVTTELRPRKGATSIPIYHECFGRASGLCYPELYINKNAKCIECGDCQAGFSPQQFVCHVHRNLENRTVHWGFDSSNWRNYLNVPKDHVEDSYEQFVQILNDMREQYEGKIGFPPPVVEPIKRKQTLTALRFFAAGSYQTDVGYNLIHGVSQSSVSRALDEVTNALNTPEILNRYVRLPSNAEELQQTRARFFEKFGFPGVIGCIDCTHVAIFPPESEIEHMFVNRKGYHSINTQLVPSVAEIIKDHELPLKKQKLSEYHGTLQQIPYSMQHIQQIYASLDPVYIQCLQEFSTGRRHLSAFKPVVQGIKGSKIRHANAMGRYTTDSPVLQNPERVVMMSESERFERSYQPNVALAPPTPKKRYGKGGMEYTNNHDTVVKTKVLSPVRIEPDTQSVETIKENHVAEEKPIVESAVSVVQRPKYNPEIELSTDTEDSASETSDKHELNKLEDVLKEVDTNIKDKVLDIIKTLNKENEKLARDSRTKEDRIRNLEFRNMELLKELNSLKLNSKENNCIHENGDLSPKSNDSINGSSIITSSDSIFNENNNKNSIHIQKSVIASVGEQKELIVKTAPE